ncbi:MAG: DJ-1/PfpI family protein [Stackebrandtia sp.]
MTDTKTIAAVAYPGLTLLDLAGPVQMLAGLSQLDPRYRVVVVAESTRPMETDAVMSIVATHRFEEVPDPDIVLVPGGMVPTFAAMADEKLLSYLHRAAAGAESMTSVCTGSLILGAAGLLTGRRATTHWSCVELLSEFGAVPVRERWVSDGPVLTAAGVSAGIDMALSLASRLSGEEAARSLQLAIEYDPEPPLGPIDWDNTDTGQWAPALAAALREGLGDDSELAGRLAARL